MSKEGGSSLISFGSKKVCRCFTGWLLDQIEGVEVAKLRCICSENDAKIATLTAAPLLYGMPMPYVGKPNIRLMQVRCKVPALLFSSL